MIFANIVDFLFAIEYVVATEEPKQSNTAYSKVIFHERIVFVTDVMLLAKPIIFTMIMSWFIPEYQIFLWSFLLVLVITYTIKWLRKLSPCCHTTNTIDNEERHVSWEAKSWLLQTQQAIYNISGYMTLGFDFKSSNDITL